MKFQFKWIPVDEVNQSIIDIINLQKCLHLLYGISYTFRKKDKIRRSFTSIWHFIEAIVSLVVHFLIPKKKLHIIYVYIHIIN